MRNGEKKAIEIFREAGGVLTTGEALERGVHPRELYVLRDRGNVEALTRGVYRLTDLPPLSDPDLVTVALRVPKAVVGLVSALHLHELTTHIPHQVDIVLPRGTRRPRLDWPPLRVFRMSSETFSWGIEEVERDGVTVRVYGPAKAVADCFRFRSRVGTDVAVEALRSGLARRRFTQAEFMKTAEVCRIGSVARPYLEALQ